MKEIITAVISVLLTTLVLWLFGFLGEKIPSIVAIPHDAVVAFDRNSCPESWVEYKAAHGRFIRGIDKSGDKIDPDGQRTPGSFQEQQVGGHRHPTYNNDGSAVDGGKFTSYINNQSAQSIYTGSNGENNENRPKNVSLLYCKKT